MPYGVILAALNDAASLNATLCGTEPDNMSRLLNRANVFVSSGRVAQIFTAPLTPRQIANRTLLRKSYPVERSIALLDRSLSRLR